MAALSHPICNPEIVFTLAACAAMIHDAPRVPREGSSAPLRVDATWLGATAPVAFSHVTLPRAAAQRLISPLSSCSRIHYGKLVLTRFNPPIRRHISASLIIVSLPIHPLLQRQREFQDCWSFVGLFSGIRRVVAYGHSAANDLFRWRCWWTFVDST